MMQDNHKCTCLLSPALICGLLSLSPQAQLSTDQSLSGNPALILCSQSFLNITLLKGWDWCAHAPHTNHLEAIDIFAQFMAGCLLYLEMTSEDFAFKEEEIHLTGKASVVVTTAWIKCSPGVKICKYINSALCFPLWEKSCYLYNTIKAYAQPCL